jgi:hypothetical protein
MNHLTSVFHPKNCGSIYITKLFVELIQRLNETIYVKNACVKSHRGANEDIIANLSLNIHNIELVAYLTLLKNLQSF